jgi:hypothetical protein
MPIDDNVNISANGGIYEIKSHFESTGTTGHYQMMGLAFDNGGTTWDWVDNATPLPIDLSASSTVGGYIEEVYNGLTYDAVAGVTAMRVRITGDEGLTVSAIVEDLIVGITTDGAFAQIGVYGTGGTAVGVTGQVSIDSTSLIGISGSPSITGSVYVLGTANVNSTTGVAVYGTGGTAVGVTGQVSIDSTSLIGISGGVTVSTMPAISVVLPTGLTNGAIITGLDAGISLDSHGLSSGIRIQAFDTGTTSEYVYVGGNTSTGLDTNGFPLREFDTIFIEVDDANKVCILSDNASAKIRYIGS